MHDKRPTSHCNSWSEPTLPLNWWPGTLHLKVNIDALELGRTIEDFFAFIPLERGSGLAVAKLCGGSAFPPHDAAASGSQSREGDQRNVVH